MKSWSPFSCWTFQFFFLAVHGGQNLHIFCQNHHRLIAAQSIRRLPPIAHQIPHFAAAFVQFAKNFRQWRFNASTEDHTSNDIHLHGKRMVAGVGDIFWGRRLCWWALLKRNICLTTEANIPIEFVKHIFYGSLYTGCWFPLHMQVVLAKYPLLSQDHQSKGNTKSATEVRMIRTKLDISFFLQNHQPKHSQFFKLKNWNSFGKIWHWD